MRFSISNADNGQVYFEIQAAGNFETLATSETYRSKRDALAAIDEIQRGAGGADVVDNT
jgi:uncharacterized protein YegP (UPF0339 family)